MGPLLALIGQGSVQAGRSWHRSVADFTGRARTARCAGPTPPDYRSAYSAGGRALANGHADGRPHPGLAIVRRRLAGGHVAARPSGPAPSRRADGRGARPLPAGCHAHEQGQHVLDPPPADPRDGLRDHRLELSVVDGRPGRRLYDAAGFEIIARVLSTRRPANTSWATHRCLMAGEGRLAGTKGSGPGSVLGRATGELAMLAW